MLWLDSCSVYAKRIDDIDDFFCRKTEYVIMDNDKEVPISIRHDERNSLTKITVEDQETVIKG